MSAAAHQHQIPVREARLAATREEALDPAQPIIDPHQHLWDQPGWRYLLDELLADLRTGDDMPATVYVQSARSMLQADGPPAMRAVNQTEFANGVAAICASGTYGGVRAAAAIVGAGDLRLGDAVRPVLEAHLRAGGEQFRGIRHIAA